MGTIAADLRVKKNLYMQRPALGANSFEAQGFLHTCPRNSGKAVCADGARCHPAKLPFRR